jgi:hypothetical protein
MAVSGKSKLLDSKDEKTATKKKNGKTYKG